MPSGTRELKRRIKSIKSTQKVTKAMEMVAAAKMRKAIGRILGTRKYSDLAWNIVLNLGKFAKPELHPLLQERKRVENIALILITSNRGLCGGFNLQLAQKAIEMLKKYEKENVSIDIITLGSRGRDIIRGMGYEVSADFEKQDLTLNIGSISPVSHLAINDFVNKKYDKVFLAFTDFVSAIKQSPRVKQLLPIIQEKDRGLGSVEGEHIENNSFAFEYLFEPNPEDVLNEMMPRLIETQIFQAVLESEASEHSARMMSMKNAKEAAGEMIDELTLTFNRARQAGITQEISEISSAAQALNKK